MPNNKDEEIAIRGAHILGPSIEAKFDELRSKILVKIEKELCDSQNAREYISQKYDELCGKIKFLTELDATVTNFRSDVKAIERQLHELGSRVEDIEKRSLERECPSMLSTFITSVEAKK